MSPHDSNSPAGKHEYGRGSRLLPWVGRNHQPGREHL
jgi:hypothetical protein